MTPAQWFRYGGCPTCEARPGAACTTRQWAMGAVLEAPHPARPLYASADVIARLLDDVVSVSVREGVSVHPGDTLVVRIDPDSGSPQQFDDLAGEIETIRAYIESRLPKDAKVVVVVADGQLGVVRGETETRGTASGPAGGQGKTGCPVHGRIPRDGCCERGATR